MPLRRFGGARPYAAVGLRAPRASLSSHVPAPQSVAGHGQGGRQLLAVSACIKAQRRRIEHQVKDVTAGPMPPFERLTRRSEFLQAARGRRWATEHFMLQARRRNGEADGLGPPRFGFTVTKKVGNAVVRNRIRRRLRELVRLYGAERGRRGYNYVLIGRRSAVQAPFTRLSADLAEALEKIHRTPSRADPAGRSRRQNNQTSGTADTRDGQ